MNIELGHLPDGSLAIVADQPLPDEVKRVEYYRDQLLFMIVYNNEQHEGDLMHYELNELSIDKVKGAPGLVIVISNANDEPVGYQVPLIQVGI